MGGAARLGRPLGQGQGHGREGIDKDVVRGDSPTPWALVVAVIEENSNLEAERRYCIVIVLESEVS